MPAGVQAHAVLVEGFVARVVTDGLFDDYGCGGWVSVGEEVGEGEVGVDRLAACGFPDWWYPGVIAVAGQRPGVGGNRRSQCRDPRVGVGGCRGVVEVWCSRSRSLSTRSGPIMTWPRGCG
jgi:hypothetical protein